MRVATNLIRIALQILGEDYMNSRVLMFIAGLVAGVLLMVFFDLPADHPGNTALSTKEEAQPQLAEDRSRVAPVDIVESRSQPKPGK